MNQNTLQQPDPDNTGRLISSGAGGPETGLKYELYLPRDLDPSLPVFTAIHGISRNPQEWMALFKPDADTHKVALLTPLFDENRYSDFQRLGRHRRGQRADHAIIKTLDTLAAEFGIMPRMSLFGFSGGAQFAHRFALAHPSRVAAMVLGAAGWYTWPDSRAPFPYGARSISSLPGVNFDLEGLLGIPTRVLVGSADTDRDASLNRSRRVDGVQGANRLERARNWVDAMRKLAASHQLAEKLDLQLLPNANHNVMERGCVNLLRSLTCEWLFNRPSHKPRNG
jgi:pimeloyl-ACP methyl ester carboxylesterase